MLCGGFRSSSGCSGKAVAAGTVLIPFPARGLGGAAVVGGARVEKPSVSGVTVLALDVVVAVVEEVEACGP